VDGWVGFTNHDLLFTIYGFMKRCPRCEVVYPDDSLRFCRNDGAELELVSAEDKRTLIKLPSLGGAAPAPTTGSLPQPATLPRLSQLTFAEAIEEYPAWSANGDEIAFSREEAGIRSIFVKRLTSSEELRLTSSDNDDIQPAWSPDARSILFVRARQPKVKLEPGDVFGSFADGDIWSIDLASRKETRLIENAFNPEYSPDGKRIAFDASWAGPRRIWAVDSRGYNPQQLTSDISEGISHVRPRWSPDGTNVVFQSIERTKFDVRLIDLTRGRSIWVTNDAVQDLNPVWSPSGRFIYFSSYRGGGINIWRVAMSPEGTAAGPPQQLTNGAGQDVEIAISRKVARLGFSILRQNADIWRLPVSPETGKPTGAPTELITTTREDSRGAWSPDCKTIAFNSDRTGEMNIWLYSIETGQTRQLTKGSGGDFQANWSPDGRRIAFFSSRAGTADIWCIEVESGELRQLTKADSVDVNPFFSPDGEMLAYNSDQSGRPEVWVMNADGSNARQLTDVGLGLMGHFMRWQPESDAVIFRCPGGGNPVTMKVRLDGSDPEPLPEVAGGSHMSFSPDRSRIMDVIGHKALWVSPLDGGKPEKVFEFDDPDVRIDYPVWSPDGRWILFDRFRPQGGDIWMMENIE
jgi:Tol biopolymer transport system component